LSSFSSSNRKSATSGIDMFGLFHYTL